MLPSNEPFSKHCTFSFRTVAPVIPTSCRILRFTRLDAIMQEIISWIRGWKIQVKLSITSCLHWKELCKRYDVKKIKKQDLKHLENISWIVFISFRLPVRHSLKKICHTKSWTADKIFLRHNKESETPLRTCCI